jgi:hypothetical protein
MNADIKTFFCGREGFKSKRSRGLYSVEPNKQEGRMKHHAAFVLFHLASTVRAAAPLGVSNELAATMRAAVAAEDATHAPRAAVQTCTVSASNACPLADMPLDETTLVYPGGATRCIFSTSSDFAFQVMRP